MTRISNPTVYVVVSSDWASVATYAGPYMDQLLTQKPVDSYNGVEEYYIQCDTAEEMVAAYLHFHAHNSRVTFMVSWTVDKAMSGWVTTGDCFQVPSQNEPLYETLCQPDNNALTAAIHSAIQTLEDALR